jgi:hypothetical protein
MSTSQSDADQPTQRERLLALFADFGVTPGLPNTADVDHGPNDVILASGEGGVVGYHGFFTLFAFDERGNFVSVGVWE